MPSRTKATKRGEKHSFNLNWEDSRRIFFASLQNLRIVIKKKMTSCVISTTVVR